MKSIIVMISAVLFIGSVFAFNFTEEAEANSQTCTTYNGIVNDCVSIPTNCACEIVITPKQK